MLGRVGCVALAFVLVGCGGGGSSEPAPPISVPGPVPQPPTPPPPSNPPSPLPGTGTGTIEFLHVFGVDVSDGLQPNGPLVLASDGHFYGTTKQGGGIPCSDAPTCGVIFRATASGVVSVVHRFKGAPDDGMTPYAGLVQGRDGALYGTTTQGGRGGRGVAFRLTLDGQYKVLHHFHALPGTGDRPVGRLVQAADGNFYGTTVGGGPYSCSGGDCGTVFQLSPEGVYRVLHYFGGKPGDGAVPKGTLSIGNDGALYGTTAVGGNPECSDPSIVPRIAGCGTIFRITTSGNLTILHAFGATTAQGIIPSGSLARGPDGALYGTTLGGGSGQCISSFGGCGTVFQITEAGAFSLVYEFSKQATRLPGETVPGSDGFNPVDDLWVGRNGLLYGGTYSGGVTTATDTGTLFSLTLSGTKTILYRFGSSQTGPAVPIGGLVEGSDGVFWGVTNYNGELGRVGARTGFGTLFRITVPRGS